MAEKNNDTQKYLLIKANTAMLALILFFVTRLYNRMDNNFAETEILKQKIGVLEARINNHDRDILNLNNINYHGKSTSEIMGGKKTGSTDIPQKQPLQMPDKPWPLLSGRGDNGFDISLIQNN